MRILHTESSTGWGGQEIRVLTEAAGMIARGHSVTLLTPPDAQIFTAATRYGVPAVALPIGRKNLRGLFTLRVWLNQNRQHFDLINTHSSTDSWLVALANKLLWRPYPILRTRHVSSPVGRAWATHWLYTRSARHIVTTGEALRAQLHRNNGFALARTTSIPTGINLQRFKKADQGNARLRLSLEAGFWVVIVATLRNWKGHAYLLDALAQLAPDYPALRLAIVGDGPQRHNLERQADALGLQSRIHFAGNRDDVENWLQAADVFTLPSYGDEGVPQSLMQAMACGLPCISTPVGAIEELIQDEATGLLVAPKDTATLAAALRRLLQDTPLRERLGQAAAEFAHKQCGHDRMLTRMEAVMRQVLESR